MFRNRASKLEYAQLWSAVAGQASDIAQVTGLAELWHPTGKTTLYLPDEQITLDTATQTVTGVRYYPLPGGGLAIRTATATTAYGFAITDQHGTPSLYLDNTAQTPTWRQYTPYGDTRGATATWPDNRGFLNKPANTSTGLTEIGARNYDPTTGRFISLDPVLQSADPDQLNGYTYSADNPITNSDPDGKNAYDSQTPCALYDCGAGNTDQSYDASPNATNKPENGWTSSGSSGGGGGGSGGGNGKAGKHKSIGRQIWNGFKGGTKDFFSGMWHGVSDPFVHAYHTFNSEYDEYGFWTALGDSYADYRADVSMGIVYGLRDTATTNFRVINAAAHGDYESASRTATTGAWTAAAAIATDGDIGIASKIKGVARVADCHSFDPATLVLLVDGNTKPIGDVKVGDKVETTDPVSGADTDQPVQQLHDNDDTDLADVTVQADDGRQDTLHTTWHHPFWNATTGQWTDAADLTPGTKLHTLDGHLETVVAVQAWTGQHHMRDLTIAHVHTYYVIAGNTPVLVHNCGGGGWGGLKGDPYDPDVVAQRSAQWQKHINDINGPTVGAFNRLRARLANGFDQANTAQQSYTDSWGRLSEGAPHNTHIYFTLGRVAWGVRGFWRGFRQM
jgi:RHS repeat-associated protein